MTKTSQQTVLISGAGIAGLTAALAMAECGFSVVIMEKAGKLSKVGAGLQLAPNATRLLTRLGVMDALLPQAVIPQALYLMDGLKAKPLMRMQLGELAAQRWNAPYVTCHRADLQNALFQTASNHPNITLHLGTEVLSHLTSPDQVTLRTDHQGTITDYSGSLAIGCDGVWSAQRGQIQSNGKAKFTGHIAWRTTMPAELVPTSFLQSLRKDVAVSAWLGPKVHLVAYPLKAGTAYNFVAITTGDDIGESWDIKGDKATLLRAFSGWSPVLSDVINASADWTFWPLFEMPKPELVINSRLVLMGDASHALTPFAAQGAAMAIEDAVSLAAHLDPAVQDHTDALASFQKQRLQRLTKVAQRGKLNRFAYHASGPVAYARNLLFNLRKPESFLADLDWLYQYDAGDLSA